MAETKDQPATSLSSSTTFHIIVPNFTLARISVPPPTLSIMLHEMCVGGYSIHIAAVVVICFLFFFGNSYLW